MRDRALCIKMTIGTVTAWAGWFLAAVFVSLNFLMPLRGYGFVSVMFCAAGATLHVRRFICQHDKNATAAFELGREVGLAGRDAMPEQRRSEPVRIR